MADKAYDDITVVSDAPRERSVGEHIFIWIAWAAAAVFWGATMSSFVGILRAGAQPSPEPVAAGVWGGALYFLFGVVALGVAIAFGAFSAAHRNRSMDPVTEASTARLYDIVERQDGEDPTTRLPEARAPADRDAAPPRW